MPIERAVPRMLRAAASTVLEFRSGIFWVAICRICFSVTLPFFSLFGVPEPFSMPAAFNSRTAAGGVLVMKLKLRPGVDGDDDGDGHAGHLRGGGACVELLAELHDVDLRLAERGAYGRRGGGFSAGDLKLDVSSNLLRCHGDNPLYCSGCGHVANCRFCLAKLLPSTTGG